MSIDLRSGEYFAPRPEDLCTKSTAIGPKDTPIPLWTAFLDRISDGDIELQAYLQRMAGYCASGLTSEHVLFFFYGTGANGKSVFINTLYASGAPMPP